MNLKRKILHYALQSTVITTGSDISGVKEFTPDLSGTSGRLCLGIGGGGGGSVLINPQTPLLHATAPTPIRATRLQHADTRGHHHHVTPATPMLVTIHCTILMYDRFADGSTFVVQKASL